MTPLAEPPPGQPCRFGLSAIDSNDLNLAAVQQQVEFAATGLALARFDDD